MTAEEIVRRLAENDAPIGDFGCMLCDEDRPLMDEPENHPTDCPWRLAVEWVATLERLVAEESAAREAATCPACGHAVEHDTIYGCLAGSCGCNRAPWGRGYPPTYSAFTYARHARERHQHGVVNGIL